MCDDTCKLDFLCEFMSLFIADHPVGMESGMYKCFSSFLVFPTILVFQVPDEFELAFMTPSNVGDISDINEVRSQESPNCFRRRRETNRQVTLA